MKIYDVGTGKTYPTIASAMAAVAALPQPLTEAQQLEVSALPLEALVIPGNIQPTASFPLNVVNVDFVRPTILSADLTATPHVRLTGFNVLGDVECGLNGQMVSENIIRGSLLAVGNGTTITFLAYNNSVHGFTTSGILVQNMRGTVRVLFNSVLSRNASGTPRYCLEIVESDIEAKYNIMMAQGGDALSRIVRYVNTTGRTTSIDGNLYWLEGSASFGRGDVGAGEVSLPTLPDWQAFSGKDAASLYEDPLFGCAGQDDLDTAINLEIAQESPAIAAAPWDADVQIDIDKTRRPRLMGDPGHSTTIGAFEQAQVITPAGKARILDLLAGLSTASITKVAVGDEGTISSAEYLQPETPSKVATDVKERIVVIPIQAPLPFDPRYVLGTTAFFDCFVSPTPAASEALLDAKMNTVSEIGLLTDDGILFLLRTIQRTPFDPLGRTTVRIRFGVTVGSNICDEVAPELTLTAE